MLAHSAGPRVAPGVAANRGDAARHRDASITPREQPCRGCGERKRICAACHICVDCRATDRKHHTRTAPACVVCDGGVPDLTRLPWHTRGMQPLTLRSPR